VAKAAPVEYVRVCSTYGAGFFYIPGTETCLRVSGRVRAEYRYLEPLDGGDPDILGRNEDAIGFRTRGRVNLDARTATAYGLLRTYVRFEMTRDTGSYGFSNTTANVDQAFIQFGGLTAGRVNSFWDNPDLPTGHFGTLRFSDNPTVNLLAYTFSFGNGFSATLSLEEGRFTNTAFGGVPVANQLIEGGQNLPDIVGNIRYAGTWGSAQVSGVLHEIRSANLVGPIGGPFDFPDSELGWGVSFQGHVNLPMLAAGSAVWIAAQYADGALGYLGFGTTSAANSGNVRIGTDVGQVVDAFIGLDGDIETGSGWSVAGGLRHYWTPTIRQNVFASYASVEYDNVAGFDFDEWRVGTNVIWSPVAGLDIGAEVIYANIDVDAVDPTDNDNDVWEARLRVQRDF
jgi:hypothetical protein